MKDSEVITANSRFAVFLTEKRFLKTFPLFGADMPLCGISALTLFQSNDIRYIRSAPRAPFCGARGAERGCEGVRKRHGESLIALGAMRKRARPAPTSSAQGGRAPLHVVYVMRLFALRMRAGLCFASPLASPSAFLCGNVCLMRLPYCRFRRCEGV